MNMNGSEHSVASIFDNKKHVLMPAVFHVFRNISVFTQGVHWYKIINFLEPSKLPGREEGKAEGAAAAIKF